MEKGRGTVQISPSHPAGSNGLFTPGAKGRRRLPPGLRNGSLSPSAASSPATARIVTVSARFASGACSDSARSMMISQSASPRRRWRCRRKFPRLRFASTRTTRRSCLRILITTPGNPAPDPISSSTPEVGGNKVTRMAESSVRWTALARSVRYPVTESRPAQQANSSRWVERSVTCSRVTERPRLLRPSERSPSTDAGREPNGSF